MMYYHWGYGPTFSWFGTILSIFWWLFVGYCLVSLIGHIGNHPPEADTNEALQILKSRYAKGEITKKEFEAMKKDIS